MSEVRLPPARMEPRDVRPRVALMLGGATLAMLLFALLGPILLFPHSLKDRSFNGKLPDFASPRLQISPRTDMAAFRAAEVQELDSYGWVDRGHGIVHVPVEAAMAKLAHDGIPGWPAPGAGK